MNGGSTFALLLGRLTSFTFRAGVLPRAGVMPLLLRAWVWLRGSGAAAGRGAAAAGRLILAPSYERREHLRTLVGAAHKLHLPAICVRIGILW